jgi:hypothetical protein
VNAPVPSNPASDKQHQKNEHRQRQSTYAAEATALLLMAAVLLIFTIIRYWRYIPWRAR